VSVSESVIWRVAMSSPRVTYSARRDATPQDELSALVAVYRTILESQSRSDRLPDKSGPDDPERRSDEIRAKTTIP
jgi:hypothetical protein